jgi:CheY-like chemotaxis protein
MKPNDRRRRRVRTERKRARDVRPPCILVAEDDADIRAMLVAALRSDGYDVVEARTGAELLDHIGSSMLFGTSYPPPDVIISDIRMPGFTGLEVLGGLRDADWSTPILLMTAYGDEGTYEEARRMGAEAVFDKPFDIEELRNAVIGAMPDEAWRRWAAAVRGPEMNWAARRLGLTAAL